MVYFVGHFNIEDLYSPGYTRAGTAGGACLYAAMGGHIWNRDIAVISRIGEDYPGRYLERLAGMGVALHLKTLPGPTMASKTEYRPGQDRKFTMKNPPQRLYALTPDVEDVARADPPPGSYVHLGAMDIGNLERITGFLRGRGCFISIDTCDAFVRENPARFLSIVAQADLFLPSRAELLAFPGAGSDPAEQALWVAARTGTQIVYKDAGNGSYVLRQGRPINIPIYAPAAAVDLTGAGDSYCGGLLAALAAGRGLIEAAVCGTVSASYIIGQGGAFVERPVTGRERDARYQEVYQNTYRKE